MKKTIVFTLLIAMFFTINVAASQEIEVHLNGQPLQFDVPPAEIEGRTMVPLRTIFESIGASVTWNEKTETIVAEKDGKVVTLQLDNCTMHVDDKQVKLDVAPLTINGRTLVPARAVAEAFDIIVNWDESTSTVLLTTETDKQEDICSISIDNFTYEEGTHDNIPAGEYIVYCTVEEGAYVETISTSTGKPIRNRIKADGKNSL